MHYFTLKKVIHYVNSTRGNSEMRGKHSVVDLHADFRILRFALLVTGGCLPTVELYVKGRQVSSVKCGSHPVAIIGQSRCTCHMRPGVLQINAMLLPAHTIHFTIP